jgi:AraC-like DNA-binding protein/tetratricopeptide (TPR) repeat protein
MTENEPTIPEKVAARTRTRIDQDREATANVWVRRILECVRVQLFRPGFNVDELRAQLGLRDHTVSEHFRTATGMTLHAYIEDRRLETACRLLLETEDRVEAIGRRVGYDHARTFHRAFDRRVGCSPTQWRDSRGTAGRWPGAEPDDHAPTHLHLPRVLVGVGSLDQGHVCVGCGRRLSPRDGLLVFEDLRPLCEICSFMRGPRQLAPFYKAALAEEDRRTDREQRELPVSWRIEPDHPADSNDSDHPDATDDSDDDADDDSDDEVLPELSMAVAQWLAAGADEEERAFGVWSEIEELSAAAQEERLRALDPPFVTEALFLRLREESQALIRDRPQRSRQLAELALIAVEILPSTLLGRGRRSYLESEAWALLANARRVACDLRGADEALAHAYECLEDGNRMTLSMARLLDYEGSLRRDQHRLAEAHACLDRALEVYRGHEPRLEAKALINKATVFDQECQPERGVEVLRQAIALATEDSGPRLLLSANQILGVCLCELERYDEAADLLPLIEDLMFGNRQRMERARVEWLRGRIEVGIGEVESGIARLQALVEGFLELASAFDAAGVCADLAMIFARTDRKEDMVTLAHTMTPLLQSKHLHREAVAALTVLQRALKQKTLPSDLAPRVRRYFKQARLNPELRLRDVR